MTSLTTIYPHADEIVNVPEWVSAYTGLVDTPYLTAAPDDDLCYSVQGV
jgi:hypothetical protein